MITRTTGMSDDIPPGPDLPHLRFLKWLVTILTITMIGGVLTIVALLVMRFGEMGSVDVPDEIVLPDGATATAFTRGASWLAIVTEDDEILIYDRATGNLRQRIRITSE